MVFKTIKRLSRAIPHAQYHLVTDDIAGFEGYNGG